jgi:hypothetical protein
VTKEKDNFDGAVPPCKELDDVLQEGTETGAADLLVFVISGCDGILMRASSTARSENIR